jgi:hypothetical protein
METGTMSHFYTVMRGMGHDITRCGSRASGAKTVAASWRGAVQTRVFIDEDGNDAFSVELIKWRGAGIHKVLATGTFGSEEGVELHCNHMVAKEWVA